MKIFNAMVIACILSVTGDVLLRIGSNKTPTWPWILGCASLYAATTPFWFIVFREAKSYTSVLFYWPIGSLVYLLSGLLVIRERPEIRQWGGIFLALIAKVIGG